MIRHHYIMNLMISLILVSVALFGASYLRSSEVPVDENVIFSDNFETGFNPLWGLPKEGIAVVPEDPNKPDGNHVARFTKERARLSAPVVKDWKEAEAKAETLKNTWGDYEFSFRWRVGKWDQDKIEQSTGTTFGIFMAACRACPSKDFPYLRYLIPFGVWKKNLIWRLSPPLVVWDRNRPFDQKNIEKVTSLNWQPDKAGRILDNEWHTFKVAVLGERVTIWWDAEIYFIGTDDHSPCGGISIEYSCNMPVEHLDIDDVLVNKIDKNGSEGK